MMRSNDCPSDIMNPKSVAPSIASDEPAVVQQFPQSGMPIISCFVTEFAEMSVQPTKIKVLCAAIKLVSLLLYEWAFNLDNVKLLIMN